MVNFNGSNGQDPIDGVIVDKAGDLFGMTMQGGANNEGTIFEITATTHALSTLATFNNSNGAYPQDNLIADAAGNLYGTAFNGGTTGNGTIFELTGSGFVVPEPGGLTLCGLATLALLLRSRDRKWDRLVMHRAGLSVGRAETEQRKAARPMLVQGRR